MKFLILKTTDYSEQQYKKFLELIEELQHEFIGFVYPDDYPAPPPAGYKMADILKLDYDIILVAEKNLYNSFLKLFNLGIPRKKFEPIFYLIEDFMTKKYEDSEDKTIQEALKYWKIHGIDVFNQHMAGVKNTLDEVFYDESCDLPYIIFKSITGDQHKMYYPKSGAGHFETIDNKIYVPNILREQVPTSPHLYIKGSHKINKGDILIDAGVCEGNFALRYIDICSKVYLFEPSEEWQKPLWYTFKDFPKDVVLFPHFLSDVTADNSISLDDAIPELNGEKIFLKMDIEGAEPAALRGGKNLLTNNKVKASVCSYHNANDIVKIKSVLKNYGYKTWTSKGYMVFYHDDNIWESMDFRKGIVYAENY